MSPRTGPFTREEFIRRFVAKVRFTDTHWLWTGAKTSADYGIISWRGQTRTAHRLSFIFFNECDDLPDSYEVHHSQLCLTPSCVHPEHLEALLKVEHSLVHNDKLFCPRGHIREASGKCNRCSVIRAQQWYWRNKSGLE